MTRTEVAVEILSYKCFAIAVTIVLAPKFYWMQSLPADIKQRTQVSIARLICRSPTSIVAYLAFARAEVVALLTDHHAAVLAVAGALVEHRTINGDQIDGIIRNAGIQSGI
jgi:hypothetical protein